MATQIQVNPYVSPRIVKILAPTTTMSIQDLTDQIKDWEDEPSNLSFPVLVSTSGKENLGGGVSVGLTAELQNAVVMFEARTESDQVGTYTGSDYPTPSNTRLIDDNANFTYTVSAGDSVINMATGAVATIISVDSATQVTHEPLDDGSNNYWAYGDDYKIWNKIQCEINGGNLVAVDDTGNDISPFLPSAFTYVIRTSASSATLQEQEDIQFSAFEGGIWIDTTNGTSGTTFPAGTARQPVDNLADALSISSTRGLDKFFIIGDITFASGDNISLKEIHGQDRSKTTITVEAGAVTAGTEFFDAIIQGTLISPSGFIDCQILNITGNTIGAIGTIVVKNCAFGGTVTLSNQLIGDIQLLDCVAGGSNNLTPIFDANGAKVDVLVRNYAGDMELRNISNPYTDMSIDMISGNIILDTTCTDGNITIRGISNLTDNSNGSLINTSGLIFADEIQLSAFNEKVSVDVSNGVSGTKFPIGTKAQPVNNISDAITIANDRGIQTLFIIGNITLGAGDEVADFTIAGQNANQTSITVEYQAVTDRVEFMDCSLTGVLDGGSIARNCIVSDITFFNGVLFNCMINPGTIELGGGITAHILDCYSGVPGVSTPIIDMGGAGQGLGMRGYAGGIRLINKTGNDAVSIDMNAGQVIIDSTVTAGTVVVRGISTLTDNSGPNTNVVTSGLVFADQTQLSSFEGQVTIDAINGSSGTKFPQGTRQFPVDNLDDALTIASSRGIRTIFIVGDFTFDYNANVSLKEIKGESISRSTLTFEAGAVTAGTEFKDATIEGVLISPSGFTNCEILDITGGTIGVTGTIIVRDCTFGGTITLSDQLVGDIQLLDCKSALPGVFTPVFNANGAQVDVAVRNYSGGMEIQGVTSQYSELSIDMNSGNIILDSSNTSGSFILRGISKLTDNTNGSTVDTSGLIFANIRTEYDNAIHIDIDNGVSGTGFPIGTPSNPVNNVIDAKTIADSVGLRAYSVEGTVVLHEDHTEWIFMGTTGSATEIVDIYGFDVTGSRFEDIKVQGAMGGEGIITTNCTIDNVTNLSGNFLRGTFIGTVTIASTVNPTVLFDVSSGGSTAVTLDVVGGGRIVGGTGLRGDWIISNMSPGPPFPPSIVSLEFMSGTITVDSSCAGGSAEFGGIANLTDNSAGTTVTSTSLLQPASQGGGAEAWDELITDHETPNTFGKKLVDVLKLKRTQP